MKTIYLKELRLTRKMLIIWGVLIAILTGFAAIEFIVLKDALAEMAVMMETFPKIVSIMFGLNGVDISTALGAYQCMVFWTNILAYFFAGFLGVYAVAREEKFGTSEFLFSKPYKRSRIVWAKIWANITNLAIFMLLISITSYLFIIIPLGDLSITGTHIATTIGTFLTQIMLFAIGLLISSVAKNYKAASLITMLTVVIFYTISFTLDYFETMNYLIFITPIRYFDVISVSARGLNPLYVILAIVIVAGGCFGANRGFAKKDLRV